MPRLGLTPTVLWPAWLLESVGKDFMPERLEYAKKDILVVLHKAGIPDDTIKAIDAQLPDPVDLDRDGPLLQRHGITHDALVSALGGSP